MRDSRHRRVKTAQSAGGARRSAPGVRRVLGQIVSYMVAAQRSGQCDADVAPIPGVARSLVRDVLADLAKRHTDEAIGTPAGIVDEATTLIADNIFLFRSK